MHGGATAQHLRELSLSTPVLPELWKQWQNKSYMKGLTPSRQSQKTPRRRIPVQIKHHGKEHVYVASFLPSTTEGQRTIGMAPNTPAQ